MTSPSPFSIKGSTEVYRNPWIVVQEDRVESSDGSPRTFGVITMKEGASVLPIYADMSVVLVREYKYGIGSNSLELMSGGLDEDESPIDAAKRELKEELGLSALTWSYKGYVDPFTTIVRSRNHLFIARDLTDGAPEPEVTESIEQVRVSLKEAVEMVEAGKITHSASCVLLLLAARLYDV